MAEPNKYKREAGRLPRRKQPPRGIVSSFTGKRLDAGARTASSVLRRQVTACMAPSDPASACPPPAGGPDRRAARARSATNRVTVAYLAKSRYCDLVGHLVVVPVAAGAEEGDRDPVARVHVVVAAAVEVVGVPVGIVGRSRTTSPYLPSRFTCSARSPSSVESRREPIAWMYPGRRSFSSLGGPPRRDHVDVDLRHDRIARHRRVIGEPAAALEPRLLAGVPHEEQRPLRRCSARAIASAISSSAHRARAVVVRAVDDRVEARRPELAGGCRRSPGSAPSAPPSGSRGVSLAPRGRTTVL